MWGTKVAMGRMLATHPELQQKGVSGVDKSRLMAAFVGLLGAPFPELRNPGKREDLEIKDAAISWSVTH